jgi:hypothetical protein
MRKYGASSIARALLGVLAAAITVANAAADNAASGPQSGSENPALLRGVDFVHPLQFSTAEQDVYTRSASGKPALAWRKQPKGG